MDFWSSVSQYKKMIPDKNLLICLLLLIFLCVGHQKFVFPSKLGCQLSAMNLATSFSQVFHGQSVHPWLCNPFSRLRGRLGVEAEEEDMVLAQTDCYCCAWLLLLVAAAHFTLVFGLHSIFTTQRYSSKLEMGEIFRKIEQKIREFFPFFIFRKPFFAFFASLALGAGGLAFKRVF